MLASEQDLFGPLCFEEKLLRAAVKSVSDPGHQGLVTGITPGGDKAGRRTALLRLGGIDV